MGNSYELKSKKIQLNSEYEVIVIGGGPAGCAAAISSAREGAKTLIIEATGCLGGMGTAGLVPAWCPTTDKEKVIYKGLAEKIIFELKDMCPHVPKEKQDWIEIDPERLKVMYDDLVIGAGADILFNTTVCDVDVENGVLNTIIVANKGGLTAYSAKVYIDCSGDADVAYMAGAEYKQGDTAKTDVQPSTYCFILSNVDDYAYRTSESLHYLNVRDFMYKNIVSTGEFPDIIDTHLCNNIIGPSTVGFNAGHLWNVDNTDPISVSKALVQGRKIARALQQALSKYLPKVFGNSYLTATASLLGIRESRRIIGDYVLNVKDYLERKTFEDEIGRNSYYIDIHQKLSEIDEANTVDHIDLQKYPMYEAGESHGIPYRCLTPKGIKNLLIAGRSISCDRIMQGSIRIMPACLVMGEASGIAANLSRNVDYDVHNIDIALLRKKIVEYGGYIK